ncbi:hypothetical protein HGA13_23575 [Nocardia speluncae]|uniref:Uncharacterized protein n=1 Tax=Nocardia speluncae TaxID=419477 RepID=A0A846XI70_9NOCA|nr:hypothetical protein [Nocardia speluncae]NKY36031.1 hypothetical protein [Nocardia speluncae]
MPPSPSRPDSRTPGRPAESLHRAAIISATAGSGPNRAEAERAAYQRLADLTSSAALANFGSADLSGAQIIEVVCTSNAR